MFYTAQAVGMTCCVCVLNDTYTGC